MDVELSPRESAIAIYRDTIHRASELGPDVVRRVKRQLAQRDLFFLLAYVLGRPDVNRDWIFERCREVEASPDGRLDLWSRGHYKDLADDTPVLTCNRGWATHGELAVGDVVYDDQGLPCRVIALSPRYIDSECYRVTFSDGAEIVAGAGHLWRVRRKGKVRVGDWWLGRRRVVWDDEIIPTHLLPCRADVGVLQAPIVGLPQQLPIDPYVLGVWLGNGDCGSSRITEGLADADEMEALLLARGVEVSRASHSNAVTLRTGNGVRGRAGSSWFTQALRDLGVYRDKAIPAQYMTASAHQRMMLLRGLMDTDGHCAIDGSATFVSANERLARDVYE